MVSSRIDRVVHVGLRSRTGMTGLLYYYPLVADDPVTLSYLKLTIGYPDFGTAGYDTD